MTTNNLSIEILAKLAKNSEKQLQDELDALGKKLKLTIQNVATANKQMSNIAGDATSNSTNATKVATKAISDYEKEVNKLLHTYKMKLTTDQEFLKNMEKLRSSTEFTSLTQRKQEQIVNRLAQAEKNFQKVLDQGSAVRKNQSKDQEKLLQDWLKAKDARINAVHQEALVINNQIKNERNLQQQRIDTINRTNQALERMQIGKDTAFKDQRVSVEVDRLKELEIGFKKGEVSARDYALQMGKVRNATALVSNEMKNVNRDGYDFVTMSTMATKKIAIWGLGTSLIYGNIRRIREGLDTLREIDGLMVEIEKVSDLSAEALKRLKDESFAAASAYGRTAQSFLKSVSEFTRAGYQEMAKGLAEVSLLAQNVGELTEDQANKFLLATDAAFKYNGSLEKLTRVLDGVNEIDNNFATTIQKVSEGMTVAGSIAENAGVQVDELAAAVGTMTAVTQRSGNEAGRAFRSILMNIRQIKG